MTKMLIHIFNIHNINIFNINKNCQLVYFRILFYLEIHASPQESFKRICHRHQPCRRHILPGLSKVLSFIEICQGPWMLFFFFCTFFPAVNSIHYRKWISSFFSLSIKLQKLVYRLEPFEERSTRK